MFLQQVSFVNLVAKSNPDRDTVYYIYHHQNIKDTVEIMKLF